MYIVAYMHFLSSKSLSANQRHPCGKDPNTFFFGCLCFFSSYFTHQRTANRNRISRSHCDNSGFFSVEDVGRYLQPKTLWLKSPCEREIPILFICISLQVWFRKNGKFVFWAFFEFPDWEISGVQNWWPEVRFERKNQEQASQLKFSFTHAMLCCVSMIIYEICENIKFFHPNSRGFLLFWLTPSVFFLAHFPVTSRGVGKLVLGLWAIMASNKDPTLWTVFLKLWMPAQIPFNMTSWRLFCDKSECQCIKW